MEVAPVPDADVIPRPAEEDWKVRVVLIVKLLAVSFYCKKCLSVEPRYIPHWYGQWFLLIEFESFLEATLALEVYDEANFYPQPPRELKLPAGRAASPLDIIKYFRDHN